MCSQENLPEMFFIKMHMGSNVPHLNVIQCWVHLNNWQYTLLIFKKETKVHLKSLTNANYQVNETKPKIWPCKKNKVCNFAKQEHHWCYLLPRGWKKKINKTKLKTPINRNCTTTECLSKKEISKFRVRSRKRRKENRKKVS